MTATKARMCILEMSPAPLSVRQLDDRVAAVQVKLGVQAFTAVFVLSLANNVLSVRFRRLACLVLFLAIVDRERFHLRSHLLLWGHEPLVSTCRRHTLSRHTCIHCQ